MPFPAHYQRVNERRRVDEMITALLAWDASTGRSVAATELAFNVPVPGTSRPVNVSGLIDRVDRSEDGRIHVVDFKTGRTAATASATAEHPQLGIYQLAIRHRRPRAAGAPGESPEGAGATGTSAGGHASRPDPTRPRHRRRDGPPRRRPDGARPPSAVALGQAELVHLADRYSSGMPKVRIQAPLDAGWTWVNDLIVDAARLADGPEYPARPNGQCKSCAFRFMCPAQGRTGAGPEPGPAAAAIGSAESSGERSEAPLTPNRPLTSPEAGPPLAGRPRASKLRRPGPADAVGG